MPYRNRLRKKIENPEQVLAIWREERIKRVGKILCYNAALLSGVATIADIFWSAPSVIITDIILLLGCLISLYWIRAESRPTYFWWPLYFSLWISFWPSLWTTGGISSPFLGIGLALLYSIGAVMDKKNNSIFYFAFCLIHIPALYVIEFFIPLSAAPHPPLILSATINAVTFAAIFMCLYAMLRTEKELSLEFSEHYHNLSLAEEELKKSESQLREAQSIARMGSWEWDLKEDRILWSEELFKIFDIKKENFDPSFRAYLERLHPDRREDIQRIIQNTRDTGEDFVFENKVFTPNEKKFILSRGRAVRNSDGKIVKMLGTSQDVTDRKRIESQLLEAHTQLEKRVEERTVQLAQSLEREKSAKESAEHASQAKMQFLANMSHEIRTPLNSIIGFSELLSSKDHSPNEGKEYVERIRNNGAQLLHLIDDILDLSKFEAGQIPIHKSSFAFKPFIDNIARSFLPLLRPKGLELKVKYEGDEFLHINADAHRLSQILTNLLSNSIKFSDSGDVKLQLKIEESDHQDSILISADIEDSGIGISIENQQSLFQPFSQGDGSVARRFGGSGLGLALSKRICEALGGKLELKKSVVGQGSHFWFQIPVEKAISKNKKIFSTAEEFTQNEFSDKSILLAEDSEDNAFLVCHYVKPLGVNVDVAIDGLQAVKMAGQKNYDCILMDIQMPGMDGLEATRKIRQKGFKNPIIALTAHALPAESVKSIQAGCDLHLTKPINKLELLSALAEKLNISRQENRG